MDGQHAHHLDEQSEQGVNIGLDCVPTMESAMDQVRQALECGLLTRRQCALLATEPNPAKIIAEVQVWTQLDLPNAEKNRIISSALREALQLFETSITPKKVMQIMQQHGGVIDAELIEQVTDVVRGQPWHRNVIQALQTPEQLISLLSWK